MNKFSVLSKNLEETNNIAKGITPFLQLDDIIILEGDLGGGKTHFVKAFAKALTASGNVTSPTYAIANFYPIDNGNILHIDAYRLSGVAEYRDLGLEEYYYESITFIEWGKKLSDEFPAFLLMQIHLDEAHETHRLIEFSFKGARWEKCFSQLNEQLKAIK